MDNEFDLPKTNDENNEPKLDEIVNEINEAENKKQEEERINAINQQHELDEETLNNNASSNAIKLLLIFVVLIALLFGFMKYVNDKNKEPEVLTQDEKILKVLKTRYGKDFTKVNSDTYKDENEVRFNIETNNNAGSKFILFDNYINVVQVNKIESKMVSILGESGLTGISVSLAPEKDCRFIGSCISNDNYNEHYAENTDETLLAERSNTIELSSYLGMSSVELFNEVRFSIHIKFQGKYDEGDEFRIRKAIDDFFEELNRSGYKNYSGFTVDVKKANGIESVLTIEGKPNDGGKFQVEN